MVELSEVLNISADEFFAQIERSVAYDAKMALEKEVDPSDIKEGFTYIKKMKNKFAIEGRVKVSITKYNKPLEYQAKFETNNGDNIITYKIKSLEDKKIEVFYSEDFYSNKRLNNLNSKLMSFF